MVKSIEAIIAIMMLFLFVFTIFSSVDVNDARESLLAKKISSALTLKSKEVGFREMIFNKEMQAVHSVIYEYADTNNLNIKICDYFQECESYGKEIPNKSVYSVNYYFYDSNKILNVVVWS